jgi:hypothetical protein
MITATGEATRRHHQIGYLGKMPSVTPEPVKTSDQARDMLKNRPG